MIFLFIFIQAITLKYDIPVYFHLGNLFGVSSIYFHPIFEVCYSIFYFHHPGHHIEVCYSIYFHPLIQDITLKYVIQYSCLFSSTDHIEVCYSIFLFIFIH